MPEFVILREKRSFIKIFFNLPSEMLCALVITEEIVETPFNHGAHYCGLHNIGLFERHSNIELSSTNDLQSRRSVPQTRHSLSVVPSCIISIICTNNRRPALFIRVHCARGLDAGTLCDVLNILMRFDSRHKTLGEIYPRRKSAIVSEI